MSGFINSCLLAFIRLFVAIDIVGVLPIFYTLTERPTPAIIEQLNLCRPIYRATTNYGHFGRPGLPWEK